MTTGNPRRKTATARATSINAVKRIPANVNVADLDFDSEDATSQNTYSLGRFLYASSNSAIRSDLVAPGAGLSGSNAQPV
jgi:hypothetical protein